jgi:excinuclease UvrABC ATPase subunit
VTITGRHLVVRQSVRDDARTPRGHIAIRGARLHNLRGVTVDEPRGVLVAETGVAGSGKNSLIHGYRLQGRNTDGVLSMSMEEARGLFSERAVRVMLDRLVEVGRTVMVIEHDLDVVARADWVIDLGPGAGHEGGRVIFEGTPARLVRAEGSLTGEHLRRRIESAGA